MTEVGKRLIKMKWKCICVSGVESTVWYWCIHNVCCVYVWVYLLLHPCQVCLERIDCRCYLGFKSSPAASVCVYIWVFVSMCERQSESKRVIDMRRVCQTQGDWERPCSQSGRSLSVCHKAAWRLLPLRQSTHTQLLPESLKNAYPSQSIGRSIGDQLAIPCNQFAPCCMATQVPHWLWHLIKLLIAVLSFLRYPPWMVIESVWTIRLSAALC